GARRRREEEERRHSSAMLARGLESMEDPRGYHLRSGSSATSMTASKRFSVIRDPVHGDVYLTHEEIAVLDTREMQRLRGIKQLGTAYLVYPGAVHTRFDHSIGTLHMAAKLIEAVNRSFELDPKAGLRGSEEGARV